MLSTLRTCDGWNVIKLLTKSLNIIHGCQVVYDWFKHNN